MVRVRFSVWLVNNHARIYGFTLLSVVTVTLPSMSSSAAAEAMTAHRAGSNPAQVS